MQRYYGYDYGRAGGLDQPQQLCYSSPSPTPTLSSSDYNDKPQSCPQTSTGLVPVDLIGDFSPSSFPPGTDPRVVECFNRIDSDSNGVIDDKELQTVLSSSCGYNFSLRTIHLLMYQFTHSNKRMIGPKEFVPLYNCLQQWKGIFQRFDRDRNGSIDSCELGQALASLSYKVSRQITNLLVSKFTRSTGERCSLKFDNFMECCLTVKGLTEAFRAKEDIYGRATFAYEEFLLNVLPFIIA